MPYAVIQEGGRQYKVAEGDAIQIEWRAEKPGAEVQFDKVLLYHDGGELHIGHPFVEGARVSGTILRQAKGPKLVAYRFRRRCSSSHDKKGHRQKLLNVKITKINPNGQRTDPEVIHGT